MNELKINYDVFEGLKYYACYLIAKNVDSRKKTITLA